MDDLRRLDLNLLVIFEAIYAAGNISHAAKALNVSQPTISNALSRLRDSVDDILFIREGRGVTPTPKAVSMIGPVREALQMIQSGVTDHDAFNPATTKRNFRIMVLDLLEPILIPPVIRKIQAYRSITLEILPIMNFPTAEGLNDGSLDLALSVFDPQLEEVECRQVGADKMVVAARKGHPMINGKMTKELLSSIGHIALVPKLRAVSRIDEALRHAKIDRHIVCTVTKFWSFPQILATTDLIAMMPRDFTELAAKNYPLDIFPVPFDFPEQQTYMIWKKGRTGDPGHKWLRQSIIEAYENSLMEL
ncbi:MAG: LysR family transcriptional regulator [Parasphingorhabdus sp.]